MHSASPSISIRAEVGPTEDPKKVALAVSKIFPSAEIDVGEDEVRATASGRGALMRFRELVLVQRTGSAVAAALERRLEGQILRFELNRLAAFASHVNLGSSVMGPLEVEMEGDDVEEVISWLCGSNPS
ncbi:MAG: hypothetical protein QGG26_10575 [Candidatus Undinarchaeales archaeon]|jgi:hypothetical protein|nr:hypothetical protein [Candidatus Undinarchaeales archaeon]